MSAVLTLSEKGAPSVTFDASDGSFIARLAGADVLLTRHAAVGLMMRLQKSPVSEPDRDARHRNHPAAQGGSITTFTKFLAAMRKLREHQSFTATGVCESKPLCATGLGGPVAVETKSMNALIKIASAKIGDETINSVNARDLHKFLGVGKEFANWIKDRVAAYDFEGGLSP
jgi:hypothetical protein